MLCDICHKNIATIHLTEIINDKVVELHICQECAKLKTEELKSQLNISDFLMGLVKEEKPKEKFILKCPRCGLTFNEFRKKGKLGCKVCYEIFRERLIPLFRKIHGSVEHCGKIPPTLEKKVILEKRIKELKRRLERAIKLEEYEEAAKIRDQIKELEKEKNV